MLDTEVFMYFHISLCTILMQALLIISSLKDEILVSWMKSDFMVSPLIDILDH
jgi:hypothetical protein